LLQKARNIMAENLEGSPRPDYEPQNFIVHAVFALAEEMERRRPSDQYTPLEQVLKEKALSAGILILGVPFVPAYFGEKIAVEFLLTANDIFKAPVDELMQHIRQKDVETP
jgi:hypothetical protein